MERELSRQPETERWSVFEARFAGPEDATFEVAFTHGDRTVRVPGFPPIDKWDDPTCTAGIPRQLYLQYLGQDSPASWSFRLPQGVRGERLQVGDRFAVDVIDTWNMTVDPVDREFTLTSVERNDAGADGEPVALPAGEALALPIRRTG